MANNFKGLNVECIAKVTHIIPKKFQKDGAENEYLSVRLQDERHGSIFVSVFPNSKCYEQIKYLQESGKEAVFSLAIKNTDVNYRVFLNNIDMPQE